MKIAKDAVSFLIPLCLIAGLLFFSGFLLTGLFFLALAVFVSFFFRDPNRDIPKNKDTILSPADGRILEVSRESDGTTKVSIFLSIWNVHINRSPIAGTVAEVCYFPGKFRMAFDKRASIDNEQNVLVIKNSSFKVKFIQIAGLLARRIVCWKKQGDSVDIGERIGLIRFGSRVDIFLPATATITVGQGHKVQGGITVIGRVGRGAE